MPASGWRVELKDDGPEKVEVEFESNDEELEIGFKASIDDGELRIEISED